MNALSEQSVGQALGSVIDPELGASLIDLNVVRRISVDDGSVSIELVLTAPAARWPAGSWSRSARQSERCQGRKAWM